MHWQYEIFEWHPTSTYNGESGSPGLRARLNELGSDGWELVTSESRGDGRSSLILKRPRPTTTPQPLH